MNDLSIRKQALHPAKSFIVQAPAGSGKTALLVYRILTVLATVERPDQLLAITFTRKASAEMKERVFELLTMAEAGTTSTDAFEQQGIALARQVLARDRALDWQLLASPQQLRLTTIDSLCARLIGDMPWLSQLGSRPVTTDNANHLYSQAVDNMLAHLLGEKSALRDALSQVMQEIDFDYGRARRLFIAMLSKRDQWLRHLVQNDLAQFKNNLEKTWLSLEHEVLDQLRSAFSREQLLRLLERANMATGLFDSATSPLGIFVDHPVNDVDALSVKHWRGLVELLTTSNVAGFRKRVNKNLGFPTDQPAHKNAMHGELALLEGDNELLSLLQKLHSLPDPNYSASDWRQIIALEQVLLALAGELQLVFRRLGECDHSEVAQRAIMALQHLENPTDLALRLDYQINHILVDEFQDTSRSQLELLQHLTAGWQFDDGRSLFLVGDPMQSIYRFREADVSLFVQVSNNVETGLFPNLIIEPLQLSENFRSRKPLVNWFNTTFLQSFPDHNDVLSGAIKYSQSTSEKHGSAEIKLDFLANSQAEALQVVSHVQQSLAASADGQVAILVRSRNQLRDIIIALDNARISFSGVDIKPLHQDPTAQDLINLCKVIVRPDARLAWLGLLRSPLLGLSLEQLLQVCSPMNGSPWEQLLARYANGEFDGTTEQRLDRFIPVMQQAMAERSQVSLHRLTRWAWSQLGGHAVANTLSTQDFDLILTMIAELEEGGDLPSVVQLDDALENVYAHSATMEGSAAEVTKHRVIISTIHKAKGLQYDTVILPGLQRQPPADSKDILMWAECNDGQGESQLLLAPLSFNSDLNRHYNYLRDLEKLRSNAETARVMYVACTRAERKLVLLAVPKIDTDGVIKAPSKGSLLHAVWPALENEFVCQTQISTAAETTAESEKTTTLQRLRADFRPDFQPSIEWQCPVPTASLPADPQEDLEFAWATELAAGVGTVLHQWLENHSNNLFDMQIDAAQQRVWRSELRQMGVPKDRISAGVKRLSDAVRSMQGDKNAKFLFTQYSIQKNEYSLTESVNGQLFRHQVDRTFIDSDGVRWVVDYKSTSTRQKDMANFVDAQVNERHREQLERYGRILYKLDPRPIKLAVYFPLLKEMRTWDYQP